MEMEVVWTRIRWAVGGSLILFSVPEKDRIRAAENREIVRWL
jgi:hypothetical protein